MQGRRLELWRTWAERVARKGLKLKVKASGVRNKGLEMDRLEESGDLREPGDLRGKNWLWLEPRRL